VGVSCSQDLDATGEAVAVFALIVEDCDVVTDGLPISDVTVRPPQPAAAKMRMPISASL